MFARRQSRSEIRSKLYRMRLLVRSKIAKWRLPPLEGTIITGSVRSGTTLALRVYCPDLTSAEERDGSIFNEPQPLSNAIVEGRIRDALLLLAPAMLNRHHLIKSPQVAFLLPYAKPIYRLIVVFRDLRLTVPSMLRHANVRELDLGERPYWAHYVKAIVPEDPIVRAVCAAEQYYAAIAAYRGPMDLWNYGFWDQWLVRAAKIDHLYARDGETAARVLEDVKRGQLFSDASFTRDIWSEFCREVTITQSQERAVYAANKRIKQLYGERGLQIKTLDELRHSGSRAT
jgi:hypothetical protein